MSLDWPARFRPVASEFFLEYNTTIFSSPITRTQQALRRQGARYRVSITLPPMYRRDGQALDAFLAQLKGAYETVLLHNFERPHPFGDNRDRSTLPRTRFSDATEFADGTRFSGGAAGVRVWRAHSQGASSILSDGWYPSVAGILLAGDYIGIGGCLYVVTADADTSAIGRATLSIAPGLRADAAHLAVITRSKPTAAFRLVDDGQPNRRVAGLVYSFQLSFVEAL